MGQFDEAFAQRIGTELLADPVCEQVTLGRPEVKEGTVIEVHLKSGVTDPVAQSVTTAIADMGGEVELVRTARKVVLLGQPSDDDIQTIIKRGPGQRLYRGLYHRCRGRTPQSPPQALRVRTAYLGPFVISMMIN